MAELAFENPMLEIYQIRTVNINDQLREMCEEMWTRVREDLDSAHTGSSEQSVEIASPSQEIASASQGSDVWLHDGEQLSQERLRDASSYARMAMARFLP